jgi:hypothetical protein
MPGPDFENPFPGGLDPAPVPDDVKADIERLNKLMEEEKAKVRKFDTGATRDTDEGKPDYEGYLSPLVIEAYGEYMLKHQEQSDHTQRSSDNWQKGIPKEQYMKSGWRHFKDWWKSHRKGTPDREAMLALMFNVMGYLHEELKPKKQKVHSMEDDRIV